MSSKKIFVQNSEESFKKKNKENSEKKNIFPNF